MEGKQRRYSFKEHLESVYIVLIDAHGGTYPEKQLATMIAYERWINDRGLIHKETKLDYMASADLDDPDYSWILH